MNRTVANIDPTSRLRRGGGGGGATAAKVPRETERPRFKALKMQQSLMKVGYNSRNRTKQAINEQKEDSFGDFNLLPELKAALSDEAFGGINRPTGIQKLAIPSLLSASDLPSQLLIASETGTGKTLAYLVPAIHAVKKAEAKDPELSAYRQRMAAEKEEQQSDGAGWKRPTREGEPHPTMARPKVVVLVPSAELVDQVGHVAKLFSHTAKCRIRLISANMSPKVIEQNVFSPSGVDVLVSTPHLLASIVESHPNVVSRVSHLIIDEADSLLDRSFGDVTRQVIDRAQSSLKQLVFVSATISRRLEKFLAERYPKMKRLLGPNLHAIPRRVQLGVIDVTKEPYRGNKDLACADAIWSIGKDAERHEERSDHMAEHELKSPSASGESTSLTRFVTGVRCIMVFVNERWKAEELTKYLVSKGIDAMAMHGDTPDKGYHEMLAMFTADGDQRATKVAEPAEPTGKRRLNNTKVIVATDLGSRGIDTVQVRHVILYDVPDTTIDFIHRLGRTGRRGRRGRGVVLVGKGDRKDVVAEVKESMFMGQALI